jgi:hypothetical protein
MAAGSFSWKMRIFMLFTRRNSASPSFFVSTVPLNCLCTESYFSRYFMYSSSMKGSLTATIVVLWFSMPALKTRRPMRPKPLIPIFTAMAV